MGWRGGPGGEGRRWLLRRAARGGGVELREAREVVDGLDRWLAVVGSRGGLEGWLGEKGIWEDPNERVAAAGRRRWMDWTA